MVKVEYGVNKLYVYSDYNADFVRKAKGLHGTWEKPAWVFDTDKEEAVRQALRDCYGDDGLGKSVIVRADLDKCESLGYLESSGQNLYLFGKQLIATRFERDSECRLPDNVYCAQGGFLSSGGSMKHPRPTYEDGTIVELSIPQTLYDEYKDSGCIELKEQVIDKRSLEEERIKLTARLREINKILANL